jgi:hypothetical protein
MLGRAGSEPDWLSPEKSESTVEGLQVKKVIDSAANATTENTTEAEKEQPKP